MIMMMIIVIVEIISSDSIGISGAGIAGVIIIMSRIEFGLGSLRDGAALAAAAGDTARSAPFVCSLTHAPGQRFA